MHPGHPGIEVAPDEGSQSPGPGDDGREADVLEPPQGPLDGGREFSGLDAQLVPDQGRPFADGPQRADPAAEDAADEEGHDDDDDEEDEGAGGDAAEPASVDDEGLEAFEPPEGAEGIDGRDSLRAASQDLMAVAHPAHENQKGRLNDVTKPDRSHASPPFRVLPRMA